MADPKTFSIVTTTEDPMTAERLVQVLVEENIDAFSRGRGTASGIAFEPSERAFYELYCPTEAMERATKVVTEELAAMARDAEENSKAAEEEALSGETPMPS